MGPRAIPKANQAAQDRPRWIASQLASGAKTIAETMKAITGSGNPDTTPSGAPSGRAGQW